MSTTASHEDYPDLIDLDVGGKHFRTTRTTLSMRGSMLENLVSEHWKEGHTNGAIFIDPNPELFHVILDYLRTNCITQHLPAQPDEQKRFVSLLQKEAEYYLLTSLVNVTSSLLAQHAPTLGLSPTLYVRIVYEGDGGLFWKIPAQDSLLNACPADREMNLSELSDRQTSGLSSTLGKINEKLIADEPDKHYQVYKLYRQQKEGDFEFILAKCDGRGFPYTGI